MLDLAHLDLDAYKAVETELKYPATRQNDIDDFIPSHTVRRYYIPLCRNITRTTVFSYTYLNRLESSQKLVRRRYRVVQRPYRSKNKIILVTTQF